MLKENSEMDALRWAVLLSTHGDIENSDDSY